MSTREIDSEKLWRCDCGGYHFVSVAGFSLGADDQESFLELILEDRANGIRDRLKAAWTTLRHGRCLVGEILLRRDVAHELVHEICRVTGLEEFTLGENVTELARPQRNQETQASGGARAIDAREGLWE